jgi:hypothetical protein
MLNNDGTYSIDAYTVALIEHFDRTIVTYQGTTSHAYSIADPRVLGIHHDGGRNHAAIGTKVVKPAVTAHIRRPFLASRTIDSPI